MLKKFSLAALAFLGLTTLVLAQSQPNLNVPNSQLNFNSGGENVAAYKTVTNNTSTVVSSVVGSFVIGDLLCANDIAGTEVDCGAQGFTAPSITRSSTEVDVTSSTTLVNVTGLVQTVVPGTYYFDIDLTGTAGGSGGWKVAFNYTTAVLSTLNATGLAYTASAVAVAATTTTTTQTSIIANTAADIQGHIVGTMIVTTGGTVQLQFAQNASNGTASSIFVGSTMLFIRIA